MAASFLPEDRAASLPLSFSLRNTVKCTPVTKAVIDRCEADRLLPSSSKAVWKDDYVIEEEVRMRGQSCDSQDTQQVSSED